MGERGAEAEPAVAQRLGVEIVDQQLGNLKLVINPVTAEQIVEIDSVDELAEFDPDYKKYN